MLWVANSKLGFISVLVIVGLSNHLKINMLCCFFGFQCTHYESTLKLKYTNYNLASEL